MVKIRNRYQWISIITRGNGIYDCILEGKTFLTFEDCQQAIEKSKKEDKEFEWTYFYSEPTCIDVRA